MCSQAAYYYSDINVVHNRLCQQEPSVGKRADAHLRTQAQTQTQTRAHIHTRPERKMFGCCRNGGGGGDGGDGGDGGGLRTAELDVIQPEAAMPFTFRTVECGMRATGDLPTEVTPVRPRGTCRATRSNCST